jgi:membrane-associated phospholipid phosphatase
MIKKYLAFNIFILLLIILSIKYLDATIAYNVMLFLQSFEFLNKTTKNIPDLLAHFVFVMTIIMWVIYFYRSKKNKFDLTEQFLRLAATVLPISYLLKTLFKYIFGRTDPRSWLMHHRQLTFHWFSVWSSSFPSGHMFVFTALGTALIFYFPKYRWLIFAFLLSLGLALIGTDYHFLSDVVAGAYCGAATTYFVKLILDKITDNGTGRNF